MTEATADAGEITVEALMVLVLMPALELAVEVVVLSEVVEPVDAAGVVFEPEPVEEEEVMPAAGEPAKEVPGLSMELAPQPTKPIAAAARTAVVLTDVIRQRMPIKMTAVATRKRITAASRKMTLTQITSWKGIGKLAVL